MKKRSLIKEIVVDIVVDIAKALVFFTIIFSIQFLVVIAFILRLNGGIFLSNCTLFISSFLALLIWFYIIGLRIDKNK